MGKGQGLDELDAARYNAWWWLSYMLPAIVMLAATCRRRPAFLCLGMLAALLGTWLLAVYAVQVKWQLRGAAAMTMEARQLVMSDGRGGAAAGPVVYELIGFAGLGAGASGCSGA